MYTYEGRVPVEEGYYFDYTSMPFNERKQKQVVENGGVDPDSMWKSYIIDSMRENFVEGVMWGAYGNEEVKKISQHIDNYMEKQVGATCVLFK